MDYLQRALQKCIDFSKELEELKTEIQNKPNDQKETIDGSVDTPVIGATDPDTFKAIQEFLSKDEIGLAFRLSNFTKEIISLLHQSVLSGEYYYLAIRDKLKEFQLLLRRRIGLQLTVRGLTRF